MKLSRLPQRFTLAIVIVILLIGVILRLQNFSLLPIDGHAMRQTDTESVAYNFAFEDPNILYPRNSLMRPITNTESYFFLELPTYQYLIAIFYMIFGWHIEVARIINLFLFIISSLCLYYFVKEYFNKAIALFTLLFFSFAPGSIFFIGHAIHPDVFAITMITISLASYIKWNKTRSLFFFVLACICLSLTVSTRPFSLIVLPAYLFLLWDHKAKWWEYPLISGFSIFFYGLWYLWTKQFKEIADHSWENWVLFGQDLLFDTNAVYNSLIMKNIAGEIIGKFVSILAVMGTVFIAIKRYKKALFPFFWLAGVPAYWYIVPNGNIYHQYYANVYMLPILIIAGIGTYYLLEFIQLKAPILVYPLIIGIFAMSLYNGYRTSAYYFKDLVYDFDLKIAEEIRDIIPQDEKLLFYQNLNSVPFSLYHRKGWVLGALPVDVEPRAEAILDLRQYGLSYIVESRRAPLIPSEEHEKLAGHIQLIHTSDWTNIYKVK